MEDFRRRRRPLLGSVRRVPSAKFVWEGPITDPDHWQLAGIAILLGILLSLPILAIRGVTARRPR